MHTCSVALTRSSPDMKLLYIDAKAAWVPHSSASCGSSQPQRRCCITGQHTHTNKRVGRVMIRQHVQSLSQWTGLTCASSASFEQRTTVRRTAGSTAVTTRSARCRCGFGRLGTATASDSASVAKRAAGNSHGGR